MGTGPGVNQLSDIEDRRRWSTRSAVLDGRRGEQRVGELHRPGDSRSLTVGDEAPRVTRPWTSPGGASRRRVGPARRSGVSRRVGPRWRHPSGGPICRAPDTQAATSASGRGPERASSPTTSDRPSASMFPAPIIRHRSPGRSIGAEEPPGRRRTPAARPTVRPPPASAAAAATSVPSTPGKSSARSRAGYTDRTAHTSARGQRGAEPLRERPRARVQVGLEHGHQPAGCERPGGGDHRGDLGRMVGVVVVHRGPRPPCARAARTAAGPRGSRASAAAAAGHVGPGERARGQRARGVDRVVGAGHGERAPATPRNTNRDPAGPRLRRRARRRRCAAGGHSARSAGRSHTTAPSPARAMNVRNVSCRSWSEA